MKYQCMRTASLYGLFLVSALTQISCDPTAPTNSNANSSMNSSPELTSKFALGAGVDPELDPAALGVSIEDENQSLLTESALIPVGAISVASGPDGAFAGFALADGNRIYFCGEANSTTEEVTLDAVVLEDTQGNLLLKQENRDDGTKITIATGDAVDIDISAEQPRITYFLNATDPPSQIVMDVSDDNLIVNEDLSSFGELNDQYNTGPIQLPRNTSSKFRTVNQEEFLCFMAMGLNQSFTGFCNFWQLISSTIPTAAIDATCITANQALDDFRGTALISVFPQLSDDPDFVRATAGTKIGLNALCTMIKGGFAIGKVIKKVTPPDLFCLGLTIADEGTRLLDEDGDSITDNICDAVLPEEDTFTIEEGTGCMNTCATANNGVCDDGGPFSDSAACELGTDCQDCGERGIIAPAEPEECDSGDGCNLDCPRFLPDSDCSSTELCSAQGTCCAGDGICDISTCTTVPDADCENFHWCDRFGICCEDDFNCERNESDCPEIDIDCLRCEEDDVCITNCEDPDPDCDKCGAGDGCVTGCEQGDPDCAESSTDASYDACGGCPLGEFCLEPELVCITGGQLCLGNDSRCPEGEICIADLCESIEKCEALNCACTDGDQRCDDGIDGCFGDADCDLCGEGDDCIANCIVPDTDCLDFSTDDDSEEGDDDDDTTEPVVPTDLECGLPVLPTEGICPDPIQLTNVSAEEKTLFLTGFGTSTEPSCWATCLYETADESAGATISFIPQHPDIVSELEFAAGACGEATTNGTNTVIDDSDFDRLLLMSTDVYLTIIVNGVTTTTNKFKTFSNDELMLEVGQSALSNALAEGFAIPCQ